MKPTPVAVILSVALSTLLLQPAPSQAAPGQGPHRRSLHEAIREAVRDVWPSLREPWHQGGRSGPEQKETSSRRARIGKGGVVTLANVAGDIVVTAGGSGEEVILTITKRTRGDADEAKRRFQDVTIDISERPGRVEVRTEYPEYTRRRTYVAVDYEVKVPADAAVEVRSVSGRVSVTGAGGEVRAESVSGDVTTTGTPKLVRAKSVSGRVEIADASGDAEMSIGSVSGSLNVKNLKARGLDLNTVSGDVTLTGTTSERVTAKTVSGRIEFAGPLAKNGRYDFNSHSGDVRLSLPDAASFDLSATTFSGDLRSEFPVMLGGRSVEGRRRGRPGRSVRATVGDGAASLAVRTFSGDVALVKAK